MNEATTGNLNDGRSFEERVFARFDSLDARIQILESQSERRAFDTKPIWERALAEIGEVKSGLGEVKTELGEVKTDLGEVKAELGEVKTELGEVKAELRDVKADLREVKVDLREVKVEVGEVKQRLGALEDLTKPVVRKIDILTKDMLTLRAEQLELEGRLEKLEPSTA